MAATNVRAKSVAEEGELGDATHTCTMVGVGPVPGVDGVGGAHVTIEGGLDREMGDESVTH
jgi:hypothetical protein